MTENFDMVNLLLAVGAAVVTYFYRRRGIEPPLPGPHPAPAPGPDPGPVPNPSPEPSPASPTPILDAIWLLIRRLQLQPAGHDFEHLVKAQDGGMVRLTVKREPPAPPQG